MKRYAAYRSASAPASRTVGSVALALAVIAFLAKRFGVIDADVFVLSLIGAALIALMAVMLAIVGLHRIWSYGGSGLPAALSGIFLGAAALVAPSLVLGMLALHSGNNDLSTDRQDPPAVVVQSLEVEQPVLAWMNRILELHLWPNLQQISAKDQSRISDREPDNPDIVSRRYRIAPAQLHAAGARALEELGWTVVDELPPDLLDAPTRLQAAGVTRVLGLKHDVTLRIRPDAVGALLDVRSRSRTPLKDLSDNADHIRIVFAEIDQVLLETYGDLARLSVEEGALDEEDLQLEPVEDPRSTIPLPGFKPYFEEEGTVVDDLELTDLEG
ncbi:RNase adapter RapZ [Roseibium sp. SCP14]|uniref:RNase adapter RapZ n=1 Tax=Roseibium sp. SCP14 TaxID=3141375 RepID=UPI0033376F30